MRQCLIFSLLICACYGFAQAEAADGSESRYRLRPTDALEVHYRYTPEFDQTVIVQPDGRINLQIVGDLNVQGMTTEQVHAAIIEKASLRLRDPEVTVVLKDFEKPYFIVGGEVANPGRFEMRGQVNAVQAIAMAGGFKSASAKHSQVILFRRVGADMAETKILDLKAAMRTSSREIPPDLRSGDLLVVPQNRMSKIERFIKFINIGLYWTPIP